MPEQQWCVRVKGAMRSDLSVELVVQAVMALGEQLQREQLPGSEPASESMQPRKETQP